jgi:hypothetical protein
VAAGLYRFSTTVVGARVLKSRVYLLCTHGESQQGLTPPKWRLSSATATTGGGHPSVGVSRAWPCNPGGLWRSQNSPSGGDVGRIQTCYTGISSWHISHTCYNPNPNRFGIFNTSQIPKSTLSRIWFMRRSGIKLNRRPNLWHIPWCLRLAINGGSDYGDLVRALPTRSR